MKGLVVFGLLIYLNQEAQLIKF